MRATKVKLKQEVTRYDAMVIMNWMENNEVTKYLNEVTNITYEIKQAIDRVNMIIMTHLFNRDGSFYLINTQDNSPVGFLKLVRRISEAEMVIVIGEQNQWGYGLGKSSILQGLNIAFFQWRMQRVIAKINPDNVRSIKAFESSGFRPEKELKHSILYGISLEEYIKRSL
ncbi:MAG: family N-acetyltransferase [Neobacillus sp.]|nr:family N-acetyltransferase [Neobacillus sp.]